MTVCLKIRGLFSRSTASNNIVLHAKSDLHVFLKCGRGLEMDDRLFQSGEREAGSIAADTIVVWQSHWFSALQGRALQRGTR